MIDEPKLFDNLLFTSESMKYNSYEIIASSAESIVFTHSNNDYLLLAKKDRKNYYTMYLYKGCYDTDKRFFEAEDILYKSFKFMIASKETLYMIFSSVIGVIFNTDLENDDILSYVLAGYFPGGVINTPDTDKTDMN